MKKLSITHLLVLAVLVLAKAQDTFSIVAVDSLTGEVGSAGASCISADNLELYFPFDDPDFLGDLLPGIGAINTQASYLPDNQDNAFEQLNNESTPQEVVDWLAANDAQNNPGVRQYGVAALINGQPMAAAYTGANCFDYKNHRVGPNYSIQGNILLGQQILDSMEARFLAAEAAGLCLSERLMAALQGAKVPGADTRCGSAPAGNGNNTSSMFAFIKVAKPGDDASDPSLRLFVSYNPVGIEPIDSLQAKFDAAAPCFTNAVVENQGDLQFRITPNPTSGLFGLQFAGPMAVGLRMEVFDSSGRCVFQRPSVSQGEQFFLENPGVYMVKLMAADGKTGWDKIVVNGK